MDYLGGFFENIIKAPMNYTAIKYFILIFFAVLLYYLFPKKIRWFILLIASGYFYYAISDSMEKIVLLVLSVLISYLVGIQLHRMARKSGEDGEERKKGSLVLLWVGILASALPLLISKVGGFVTETILHSENPLNLVVPIGLSFYTLQIISYLVDIYKGKTQPQQNLLKYTLYISFFPIIIQGPISRYEQLGDQLFRGNRYETENIIKGVQAIIWGFFMKLMIADKAAVVADTIFGGYQNFSGFYILLAGFLYTFQLYTDFLSCVTISQGVAGLFGIQLQDNFARPLLSVSIRDFWRRWHISLSEWLRDYIYIPLGGSRKGRIRKYVNLFVTFTVSGLWHGTGWKFLVWGWLHAGYQVIGDVTRGPKDRLMTAVSIRRDSKTRKVLQIIVTFLLCMIGWIFFRAGSLSAGVSMLKSMVTDFNPWIFFDGSLYNLGLVRKEWQVLFLSILFFAVVGLLQERGVRIRDVINRQNFIIRWVIYLVAIWSIWIFGTYGFGFNAQDFIYGGF